MLRKFIAAGALMLAAMCLAVPASYADVGPSFHPLEASSHVMEVDSHGIAVDLATNCSNSPARVAVATPHGSIGVERLSACVHDFHFGSGSLAVNLMGSGDDDEPIAWFYPAVAPHVMPSTDGDHLRTDDPGWCLSYQVD